MPSLNSKRLTIVPVTTPIVSLTSSPKYTKIEKLQKNVHLTANPHVVVTSLDKVFSHSGNPDSPTRSPVVPSPTWSPGLGRKLRWRLRQYTLWENLVFVAFIIAIVVLFGALVGWGYLPDNPEPYGLPLGWRAPGVLRRAETPRDAVSETNVFGGIIGFSRYSPTQTRGEDHGGRYDTNGIHASDDQKGSDSVNTHQATYQRLRYGAWQQRIRGRMTFPILEAENKESNSRFHSDLTGGPEEIRNDLLQLTVTSRDTISLDPPVGDSENEQTVDNRRNERKWRWQPQGTT